MTETEQVVNQVMNPYHTCRSLNCGNLTREEYCSRCKEGLYSLANVLTRGPGIFPNWGESLKIIGGALFLAWIIFGIAWILFLVF